MGTTLTGTTPQDTYDSLIKVTDNGPIGATPKLLSDGLGNDSSLALSTSFTSVRGGQQLRLYRTDNAVYGSIEYIAGGVGFKFDDVNSDGYRFVQGANTAMAINTSGNVGIGTSAPASILNISAASPTITLTATTTTATTIGNKNNRLLLLADSTTGGNGGEVVFGTGDTSTGRWAAISGNITANSGTGSAGSIIFATKAAAVDTSLTERVRILNDGGLTFNGDTAQANALDDYEEGTWTIGVSFGGASVGVTTSANTGTYTKIGRQVTVNGQLTLTSKGSSTGAASLTGLPFTIPATTGNRTTASLRFSAISFTNQFQGFGATGATTINLEQITVLGADTDITNANFANNSSIMVNFTYFV